MNLLELEIYLRAAKIYLGAAKIYLGAAKIYLGAAGIYLGAAKTIFPPSRSISGDPLTSNRRSRSCPRAPALPPTSSIPGTP